MSLIKHYIDLNPEILEESFPNDADYQYNAATQNFAYSSASEEKLLAEFEQEQLTEKYLGNQYN